MTRFSTAVINIPIGYPHWNDWGKGGAFQGFQQSLNKKWKTVKSAGNQG
jgi:hypothetical protein